jgi:hypothetical protein
MVIMVILAPCGKSRQIWRAIHINCIRIYFFLKYEINDQKDQKPHKPARSAR